MRSGGPRRDRGTPGAGLHRSTVQTAQAASMPMAGPARARFGSRAPPSRTTIRFRRAATLARKPRHGHTPRPVRATPVPPSRARCRVVHAGPTPSRTPAPAVTWVHRGGNLLLLVRLPGHDTLATRPPPPHRTTPPKHAAAPPPHHGPACVFPGAFSIHTFRPRPPLRTSRDHPQRAPFRLAGGRHSRPRRRIISSAPYSSSVRCHQGGREVSASPTGTLTGCWAGGCSAKPRPDLPSRNASPARTRPHSPRGPNVRGST